MATNLGSIFPNDHHNNVPWAVTIIIYRGSLNTKSYFKGSSLLSRSGKAGLDEGAEKVVSGTHCHGHFEFPPSISRRLLHWLEYCLDYEWAARGSLFTSRVIGDIMYKCNCAKYLAKSWKPNATHCLKLLLLLQTTVGLWIQSSRDHGCEELLITWLWSLIHKAVLTNASTSGHVIGTWWNPDHQFL